MTLHFEWHDEKAATNKRLHGISFEAAKLALQDPHRLVYEDSLVEGEQRWRAIGMADHTAILLVIYFEGLGEMTSICVSFQPGRQHPSKGESMSKIVRMTSESPITSEVKEELRQIAAMPDSEIDTTEIPEWTPAQFAAARARRQQRLVRESAALHKKAS